MVRSLPRRRPLPMNPDPKFSVSADRKTFILKTGDWTWTYTPTIVQ